MFPSLLHIIKFILIIVLIKDDVVSVVKTCTLHGLNSDLTAGFDFLPIYFFLQPWEIAQIFIELLTKVQNMGYV